MHSWQKIKLSEFYATHYKYMNDCKKGQYDIGLDLIKHVRCASSYSDFIIESGDKALNFFFKQSDCCFCFRY